MSVSSNCRSRGENDVRRGDATSSRNAGVNTAAAPLRGVEGRVVATLSVTGPSTRLDHDALDHLRHDEVVVRVGVGRVVDVRIGGRSALLDQVEKAGQDRERQKNEGQAYANDVIPRARGAASLSPGSCVRRSATAAFRWPKVPRP